jgi:hypothetical protein
MRSNQINSFGSIRIELVGHLGNAGLGAGLIAVLARDRSGKNLTVCSLTRELATTTAATEAFPAASSLAMRQLSGARGALAEEADQSLWCGLAREATPAAVAQQDATRIPTNGTIAVS